MEKFFRVKEDSDLYKDYFSWLKYQDQIREAFIKLSDRFGIEAHTFLADSKHHLSIDATKEDRQKFRQDFTQRSEYGSCFKLKSEVGQAWIELTKEIPYRSKPRLLFYMHGDFHRFSERLFDIGEVLYASFEAYGCAFRVLQDCKDFLEEIKASEFYKIVEDYQEEARKNGQISMFDI